jgi:transcriptional regulator with XRE-family HTH domain
MNTLEYLTACKERLGIESDYALAKALGVAQTTVSSYRIGRSRIDDNVALSIASILEIEPIVVIAHANAERAKTKEQKARWLGLVEKFSVPTKSFRSLLSWDGHTERRGQSRLLMQ